MRTPSGGPLFEAMSGRCRCFNSSVFAFLMVFKIWQHIGHFTRRPAFYTVDDDTRNSVIRTKKLCCVSTVKAQQYYVMRTLSMCSGFSVDLKLLAQFQRQKESVWAQPWYPEVPSSKTHAVTGRIICTRMLCLVFTTLLTSKYRFT
jgi:hypothetical protein